MYDINTSMISILTGDIVNSSKSVPDNWLHALKEVLAHYGAEPSQWEIYRGDSFQLEVKPEKALGAAILIKATIRQFKGIDVRLAIGIGEKTYSADKIKESNGTAFIHSGQCFEKLKKHTLAIKSPWLSFDNNINLCLQLALLSIDKWTPASSKVVKMALESPELSQIELAKKMNRTQSTISEILKRAGFEEITKMIAYYNTTFSELQ